MLQITSTYLRREWANLPLRAKGIVVLLLPLTALLLNSVANTLVASAQQRAQSMVIHTLDVRVLLEHVIADMAMANTGSVTFKLTKDKNALVHRPVNPLLNYSSSVWLDGDETFWDG
jgi:hypothetical protein